MDQTGGENSRRAATADEVRASEHMAAGYGRAEDRPGWAAGQQGRGLGLGRRVDGLEAGEGAAARPGKEPGESERWGRTAKGPGDGTGGERLRE